MVKVHAVKQLLEEVVEKHDWFLDPFSCETLRLSAHSLKIVVTADGEQENNAGGGAQLTAPWRGRVVPQSVEREEDSLLPVFCAIATNLFPSGFDFRSNRRVLVNGGPSCGKSTLLKHLAILCATKQDPRVLGANHNVPFVPLIISVARLTDFISSQELGPHDDILQRFYSMKNERAYARKELFDAVLKGGRYWLLLDGLDESTAPEPFEVLMQYLRRMVEENEQLRVVMTSRHGVRDAKHQELLDELHFCTLRMRPLTTSLAERIVAKRICGTSDSALFSSEKLPDWLKSELRRPQYKLFRKSPLCLMLLVHVLQDIDHEHRRKAELRSRTPAAVRGQRQAFGLLSSDGSTPRSSVTLGGAKSSSVAADGKVGDTGDQGSLLDEVLQEEEEQDPHNDEHYKQTCQGRQLVPPYSRIDLFRRAIVKLLNWRPVESQNKTTCCSPATGQPKIGGGGGGGGGSRHLFAGMDPGFALLIPPSVQLHSFHETDQHLLELLQVVAYRTHERNSREVKLRALQASCDMCSEPELTRRALKGLLERIHLDEAPLFTMEDRDDFLEEETLEQQQHQQPRHQPVIPASPDELKVRGVVIFLHQTLQEHFTAEHLANQFLALVQPGAGASRRTLSSFSSRDGDAAGSVEPQSRGFCQRRRSRSVVNKGSPKAAGVPFGRSGGLLTTRRASVSVVETPEINYENETLREQIKDLVERLMLGHFEQTSYRIASDWWQPVLLTVLDLIREQAPAPSQERGPTMFDVTLQQLVSSCRRLQQYNNGRAPACLESFWLAAAAHGNVEVAKGMIAILGVQTVLQATNGDWNNAMHLAAVNNQPEIIKLLMAEDHVDADYLDRNNQHGWDPSNMAMVFNHTYCFRLLCCTDGDKVAETDRESKRPQLADAAMKGKLDKVRELLLDDQDETSDEEDECDEAGHANAENRNAFSNNNKPSGGTTNNITSSTTTNNNRFGNRLNAAHKRRRATERKKGVDLARICSSSMGSSMLRNRRRITMRKQVVDVNAKGSTGMTAAMWAARNGHVEILKELITRGANIELKAQGISALIFAVESGHVECVKVLIEAGADPMDRTPDDDSSLLCACSFGFDDVARVLIEAGASALEALVVSCVQGKDCTVRSLVEGGLVDVNTVWQDLMVTPLAGACVAGHVSTVKLLLALGADPNVSIDVEYGSSPLMLACHMGNPEVVQTMLDAGADVNARTPPSSQCASANGQNTTAVSIARLNGHDEVERLLRSYGAKAHVPVDLTSYEWLGGHVRWPLLSPDFEVRREAGTDMRTLLDDDEFVDRVDLLAWQFLGGRTAGERAWEPRN